MDHRVALTPDSSLWLCNGNDEVIRCVIKNEIGRGASCIVYEAFKLTENGDKTVFRVKEYYPLKLSIERNADGWLMPTGRDAAAFKKGREQFQADYSITNRLYYSGNNYSSMTNQFGLYCQNGTSYILSTYSSKETLVSYKPKTIKECIMLTRQVAYVLESIHREGYLYLDTKPDNVLVVEGEQKQIRLFDFDSLFKLSDITKRNAPSCNEIRLSFSKGFAPVELQTSKIKRLGPHTDVFGIGALLYYLLFGRTPQATECDTEAEYDFSSLQYDEDKYDNKLFFALTNFFHGTLAVYCADRYQSMQAVYELLRNIEKLADPTIPRIFSTKIIRPSFFYGRETELLKLSDLINDNSTYNCIFITGMGGIGKSTFIREFLAINFDKYDTILYMQYGDSIESTISNDDNIEINTLSQADEGACQKEYYQKKIKKIRELTRGKSAIIVIDNFSGEVDDDLNQLIMTGCKIVLVTRQSPEYRNCHRLWLEAIDDTDALQHLFEENL